ncbi:sigma-54 dependent transcriptional regulator [Opitutus sp. ER46]|uniref:sigma-54-dependent transcriptional regulator n=1 Tax=Opitutus sp. ER46 TaxID=2161864 RepID=UPI000D31FA4E|nr:sigma-54 dependent transcriptional regulator [Opitutus sp. ER46]PTX99029.1 DNA-binding response regulator [Opitutus sp. ER46]
MPTSPLAGLNVLLLEDELLLRKRLAGFLEKEGADVTALGSVADARRAVQGLSFEAALLDVNLPDGRGTDLLREKLFPATTTVIVMTAEGGVAGAVEAIRAGASDYLVKPFDPQELPVRFAQARRARQAKRVDEFRRGQEAELVFGESLAGVREQLLKITTADRRLGHHLPPVLIEGETGTGKTAIARWIHRNGPRAEEALIEINCSAMPEALAESELFGHERGAFTDAKAARIGLMEAADGGSLFLDELPSLAQSMQAKLLTALEDHSIRRVGSTRSISVDARIIAATNSDLNSLVASGRFREDLLHRLDLFRVRLPPLRERGNDILILAEELLARVCRRYGMPVPEIPTNGRRRLLAHNWPGNVRELAHEIERAVVFGGEEGLAFRHLGGDASDLSGAGWLRPGFNFPESGFSLEQAIDELVAKAVQQADGNVSAAARLLGVSRDVVRYRMKTKESAESGK